MKSFETNFVDKRIAIISDVHPENEVGGAGTIAYDFFKILTSREIGVEFWFGCTKNDSFSEKRKNESAFFFKSSRFRIFQIYQELIGLRALIWVVGRVRTSKPDLVWINQIGNRIPYLVIPVLRIMGVKVLLTMHDFLPISKFKLGILNPKAEVKLENISFDSGLYPRFRRRLLSGFVGLANWKICVSSLQMKVLSQFGIQCNAVIPNGVSRCNHNLETGGRYRDQVERRVLFAGRLQMKGLEIVCSAILNSNRNWRLHLAGDSDLLQRAIQLLPHEIIEYHGVLSRQELGELMHNVDLVSACSQYFDPYPTICLEAVRHGTPFLTTSTSGTSVLFPSILDIPLILDVGEIPDLDDVLSYSQNETSLLKTINSKIPTLDDVCDDYLIYMSKAFL